MPRCWWRRPARARRRGFRSRSWTNHGRRGSASSCSSRGGSRRAQRPPEWPRRWVRRSGRRWVTGCGSAPRCRAPPASRWSPRACFTRMVLDNAALDGVAALLFDEFHERSLDADLGLALARDVQQGLREDLRLLVMSATLDGARVAALLGDAPVIESQGRAFPVETRYLGRDAQAPVERQVAEAATRALRADAGSLLIFLPGAAEIRRTETLLRERISDPAVDIVPLYGALEADVQDRAIAPAPPGRRKVVLATSIAETSLTIDGVRVVIDSGLARRAALRAGRRADASRDCAGIARRRRSAPRPCRTHRARHLLSAVGRAADRIAGSGECPGDFGRRPQRLRARPGALGRHRSGQARVSRSAAGGRHQGGEGAASQSWCHRCRRPDYGARTGAAQAAAAAAACPHGGGGRGDRKRGAGGRDRNAAHRARAWRQRCRSHPSSRRPAARSLAPRPGRAGHGEALGGDCRRW